MREKLTRFGVDDFVRSSCINISEWRARGEREDEQASAAAAASTTRAGA